MSRAPITADAPSTSVRPWVVAGIGLVVLLVALSAVVWASQRAGGDTAPPPLPEFQAPQREQAARYEVRSVEAGKALLVADATRGQSVDVTREVLLSDARRIEVLRPLEARAIRPGDSVTVTGVYNEVRNFSVRSVIVQRGQPTTDADGVVRSPAGFAGYETAKDANERAILSGKVASVEQSAIVIDRPAGQVRIELTPDAPLWLLEHGEVKDAQAGGRAAIIEGADGLNLLLALP